MPRYGFEVDAPDQVEAFVKLYKYFNGEDCICGRPQWGEQADSEGQDQCDCVIVSITREKVKNDRSN